MSESAGSGAGQREVAYRLFAAEFEAADYAYSESDEERAPNYVITPTGARANRLFTVGVLTEVEEVSEDVLRARVVDPTGAFVLYAGQYQPDEQAFLERATPPTFVAVTGKARTFTPDDSDQVFTSVRPESINEVDMETRDRWTVQTAKQTIDRIGWMATALSLGAETDGLRDRLRESGADDGLAHGIELALDHYGTTPTYLDAVYEMSLDAARVVAGETDEIEEQRARPDSDGDVTVADLAAKVTLPADGTASETETAETEHSGESEAEMQASDSETQSSDVETQSTDEAQSVDDQSGESSSETGPGGTEPTVEATGVDDSEHTDEVDPTATETETATVETDQRAEPKETAGSKTETEPTETTDELGDFASDEFELEDETREEIEAEFGTDFQTGTEVDEPGNADIETPDPEEIEASEADETTETETTEPADEPDVVDKSEEQTDAEPTQESADTDAEPTQESADTDAGTAPEGPDAATLDDPEEAVIELMEDLDSGDGADRDQLIAEMKQRYDIDRESVEEAIQSALMDGKCYEPNDDTLKPI